MTNQRSFPPGLPGPLGPNGDGCPDPEMLSSYLDGKLDPVQRGRIEEHISRCEDCYFVVRETAIIRADEGAEGSSPGGADAPQRGAGGSESTDEMSRAPKPVAAEGFAAARYLLPLAAMLAVGAGSVALWRQAHPVDPYAEAIRPLVEAVGERRFFEARLTGGFSFGPLVTPHRGAGQGSENWAVLGAAAKIESDARADRDVSARHALAVALTLAGEPDRAIAELESISSKSPSAGAWSDLSAALLVRANEGHPSDFPRALDAAVRSLRIREDLPEALHNKALALEALGLIDDAHATWLHLAERLGSGPWAEEARRRADALARRIGEQGGDPRVEAPEPEDPSWAEWASRVLAQQDADETLSPAAPRLDESYALASRDLRALRGPARKQAALAIRDLFSAVTASKADKWKESRDLAFDAAARLRSVSEPIHRLALVRAGAAQYYLTDNPGALKTLREAYQGVPPGHRLVRARAGWMVGTLLAVGEEFFEAAKAHRESAALYRDLGQGAHAAFVSGLYAQDLFAQGLEDDAWAIWASLVGDPQMRAQPPRRQFTVLWEAARRLLEESPCASLQFLNRAVTQGEASGESGLEFSAKVRRGRAALRCGQAQLAAEDESRARSLIGGIPADLRPRWTRDADVLATEIRLADGDTTASFTESVEFFRASGNAFNALEVSRKEAEVEMDRGDLNSAVASLTRERAHYLKLSTRLSPVELRILAARQAGLRDRLIDLLMKQGQGREALGVALEAFGPWSGEAGVSALERIARQQQKGILVLAACGSEVCSWGLGAGAAGAGEGVRTPAEPVNDVVSRAVGRAFAPAPRALTVVSDLDLSWGREFAVAERDAATTISLGVPAMESGVPVARNEGVTLLAHAAETRIGSRTLPALPSVSEEEQQLRTRYGDRFELADPQHLVESVGSRTVLHIAGHQVRGGRERGGLLVVGDDYVLSAVALARQKWTRLPALAIVNVCGEAGEGKESSISLAQGLSIAGVPTVVGATEPVRDSTATAAAERIHGAGEGPELDVTLRDLRKTCLTPQAFDCAAYIKLTRLSFTSSRI